MGDTTIFEMAMKRRNDELRAEKWTICDLFAIPVSLVLFLVLFVWVAVIVVVTQGLMVYEKLNHRPGGKSTRHI